MLCDASALDFTSDSVLKLMRDTSSSTVAEKGLFLFLFAQKAGNSDGATHSLDRSIAVLTGVSCAELSFSKFVRFPHKCPDGRSRAVP